jgi:hypothetical protein
MPTPTSPSDERKGCSFRALEARPRVDAPAREHRARRVDDHERLGVGADDPGDRTLDDRLGGREAEQCRRGDERPQPGAYARLRETQRAAHATRPAASRAENGQREEDGQADQRAERGDECEAQ